MTRWALVALACTSVARADDHGRSWDTIHAALLEEALDGDLQAARDSYEDLVHNHLPAGDPALAEMLFWLGDVRYLLGDLEGARRALDECNRTGMNKARCLDLRGDIDLLEDSITTVPVAWSFDDADHGFAHPRAYWDKGSIRISQNPQSRDSVLAWSTSVDPLKTDLLVVGFNHPSPPPVSVGFNVTSTQLDGAIRLKFIDNNGREFVPSTGTFSLPQDRAVRVHVMLENVAAAGSIDDPLDPTRLHQLIIEDVTNYKGLNGPNELHIDDFIVR